MKPSHPNTASLGKFECSTKFDLSLLIRSATPRDDLGEANINIATLPPPHPKLGRTAEDLGFCDALCAHLCIAAGLRPSLWLLDEACSRTKHAMPFLVSQSSLGKMETNLCYFLAGTRLLEVRSLTS